VDRLARLVADETAALGPEHKQTLDSRNILGYWLGKAGDGQEALAYLKELPAFRTRLAGCLLMRTRRGLTCLSPGDLRCEPCL
jgi:hypothetical protein